MAESSLPWGGTVTGDAGPYTDDDWSDMFRKLFMFDRTTQGVLAGYANELIVTGASSPVSVDTGAAMVDGKFYESTSVETFTISTPSASTRVDRIVLEKDWTAQTVRLARVDGVEGAGVPALTQSDGSTWQIPIYQVSITTGGVITLTDDRSYLSPAGVPVNSVFYTSAGSAPNGFSEYTTARGRMIVGLPSGGTNQGTVGTALTDLQDKTHDHTYTTVIAHSHDIYKTGGEGGSIRGIETKNRNSASYQTQSPNPYIEETGSASGTTSTAAISDFMSYVQLMTVSKD